MVISALPKILFSAATHSAGEYIEQGSLGLPVTAPWKTAVEYFVKKSFATFANKPLSYSCREIKGNSSTNYLLMAGSVLGGAFAWKSRCLIVKNCVGQIARYLFLWRATVMIDELPVIPFKKSIKALVIGGLLIEAAHNGNFANRYPDQPLFARYVFAGLRIVIDKNLRANCSERIFSYSFSPICYAVSLIFCKMANRPFNLSIFPVIANIFNEALLTT